MEVSKYLICITVIYLLQYSLINIVNDVNSRHYSFPSCTEYTIPNAILYFITSFKIVPIKLQAAKLLIIY